MAQQPTRLEYRISLSQVDRGVDASETVIVGRHPSESPTHLVLRVLAWCLLYEERLEFGPGLCIGDAADVKATDLTGRLKTWIECGAGRSAELKKLLQHNPGLALHVVLEDARKANTLLEEIAEWGAPPRGGGELAVWLVDAAFVRELAADEERRHKWTVTVVGDHFYLEADGKPLEGAVQRLTPAWTGKRS